MTMKRSLASAVGSQVWIFVFGFGNAVLTAQVLGAEGKGQLAIYMLALEIGAVLMVLGVNQALQYYASRDEFRSQRTLNTAMLFAVACGTVFFLVVQLAFFLGQGDRMLAAPFNTSLFRVLIAIQFVLQFAWMLLGSILNSYKLFWEGYKVALLQIGLLFCLYLGLFGLQRSGTLEVTVVHVYLSLVSTAMLSVWLGLRTYFKHVPARGGASSYELLQRAHVLKLVSFGLFPWISAFMMRAVAKLDFWFVEAYIGLDALGQYSVAANIGETLYLVPNTVGLVLLSFVADPETRDDSTHRTATIARLFFVTMIFGAIVVSTISSDLFAFVFGSDFRASGPLFNVMLWGIVPFSLATILLGYLTGARQLKPVVTAAAIGLALTIVLNLALIPRMGAMGAAATRVIAFNAMTWYLVVCFKRASGLPYRRFLWPSSADVQVVKKLLRRVGRA